jgi:hypothetical protein
VHDYTTVNSTATRSCSTSPFSQPAAMCAPEVSTVEIGAGARKKETGVVSLSVLSLTPPSLLKNAEDVVLGRDEDDIDDKELAR